MAAGAGPYTGYSKNYKPIKSSKGTKAEKVVGKVISAAGGGVKPQKVKVAGKTMTTKPSEAGLGVVGTMARAAARTAAANAVRTTARDTVGPLQSRAVRQTADAVKKGAALRKQEYALRNAKRAGKGPSPKTVKAIREARADQAGNRRESFYRNEPILSKKAQAKRDKDDLGRGAEGTPRNGRAARESAARKGRSERANKEITRAGELLGNSVRGKSTMSGILRSMSAKSPTNTARQTKVPVKGRTSPKKRSK